MVSMNTVTAKELRQNLSHYLDQLEKGQEVSVIRHSRVIGRLTPVNNARLGSGTAILEGLEVYDKAVQGQKVDLSAYQGDLKELYSKTLSQSPKYRSYSKGE